MPIQDQKVLDLQQFLQQSKAQEQVATEELAKIREGCNNLRKEMSAAFDSSERAEFNTEDRRALEAEIELLKEEKAGLVLRIDDIISEVTVAQGRIEKLKKENDVLRKRARNAEADLRDQRNLNNVTEAGLENVTKTNDKVMRSSRAAQDLSDTLIASLEKRNAVLERRKGQTEAELHSLKAHLRRMVNEWNCTDHKNKQTIVDFALTLLLATALPPNR